MSTELLPCQYCGNNEPDTTTVETLAMKLTDDDTVRCGMEGCPIENVSMLVRDWNRRFACADWQFCCNTCDHKCAIAAAMAAERKEE